LKNIAFSFFGGKERDFESRWGLFAKTLCGNQYQLHYEWAEETAALVFIDFTEADYERLRIQPFGGPKFLILVEPASVNSFQYNQERIELFDQVYTFSLETAELYGVQYLRYMTPTRKWSIPSKQTYKPRFGIISANKNSLSPKSLYKSRRQAIYNLSRSKLDFVYAGFGWDSSRLNDLISDFRLFRYFRRSHSKYDLTQIRIFEKNRKLQNYVGPVTSKESFLSVLDVEICIENCRDELSEKLFDSIQANVVPVYQGVSLEKYGIPQDIVFLAPENPKKLVPFLSAITIQEITEKRLKGQEWWEKNKNLWSEEDRIDELSQRILKFIHLND
jgi:hypothetical protein